MVVLDPTTHTYLDSDNNTYQSVTKFISKFVPEFNFDEKSQMYATKYGMNVEEVRDSWKQKNKVSTDFGTLIHEQIENSLKNKTIDRNFKFKNSVKEINDLLEFDFKMNDFLMEHAVWNSEHRIAGTSDLIINEENSFNIIDFKTNKQIKYVNDYEDKFLLKPINHLPNGEYFKYALQLSFYAYFYKLTNNKIPHRLCFYWLKRKNNSYDDPTGSKWIRYNVPYLEEEVKMLLDYVR